MKSVTSHFYNLETTLLYKSLKNSRFDGLFISTLYRAEHTGTNKCTGTGLADELKTSKTQPDRKEESTHFVIFDRFAIQNDVSQM